ncbi:MAG: TAXI family TRAP transporter solute-binding subunit [Paracoccaceae bacterium]
MFHSTIFKAIAVVATLTGTSALAQTVAVGSNPQGSVAYATAAAISSVVSDKTDLRMRVVPQGGPNVTLPLVNSGELEFSVSAALAVGFAQQGRAMFKDRPQDGALMVGSMYNINVGIFVREDSGITSLVDLKGRTASSEFNKQRVIGLMQKAILATVGMSPGDLEGVPVPSGLRGVEDFISGTVDAGIFTVTSGKVLEANAAVGGIRWLGLPTTDEANATLDKIAPGSFVEVLEPAENRPGITEPTGTFANPFLLVAGANTPDDVVYEVTKTLYENQAALATAGKAFAGFDPAAMAPDLGINIHPGALRFYKEVGLID